MLTSLIHSSVTILNLFEFSNDERPTIKELANEFGVGVRTIQRDIYERLAYFPIEKDSEDKYNTPRNLNKFF